MIREIWGKECLALADTLGESPETAIQVHLLRRGLCRVYISGNSDKFDGVIIQSNFLPGEPMGFGSDPKALWELLKCVDGWFCVEVIPECARGLGEIIEREIGDRIKYYDDVYHALCKPVTDYRNKYVRQLTLGDIEMLESAHEELRESCFESTESLLMDGFAAGAIVSGNVVAVAHTSGRSKNYADIGVYALEEWRNRGFVTAAASIVARRVQEAGQIPVWSTGEDNFASLRVAKKLGFKEVSRWTYVIRMKEGYL
jgi:hypothetical protein